MTDRNRQPSFFARLQSIVRRALSGGGARTSTPAVESGVEAVVLPEAETRLISDYFDLLRQQGALEERLAPDPTSIALYVESPCDAERELLWAFDSCFYLSHSHDVAARGENPLVHFIKCGWLEGRSPSPLIDIPHMVRLRPELGAGKNCAPLAAFLSESASRSVSTHPLFNEDYYASQLKTPILGSALKHFLGGLGGGARPHRLFAPSYYLSQIPTLEARQSPLRHYLCEGWRMGLKPHPEFDTAYYLSANPDVAAAGVEPLTHYVEHGQMEDRNPSYAFHSATYRKLVGFEKTPEMSPLEHKLIYNA